MFVAHNPVTEDAVVIAPERGLASPMTRRRDRWVVGAPAGDGPPPGFEVVTSPEAAGALLREALDALNGAPFADARSGTYVNDGFVLFIEESRWRRVMPVGRILHLADLDDEDRREAVVALADGDRIIIDEPLDTVLARMQASAAALRR